jgi:2,3-bisphosphoglycerate-independent phosphoglycerate mutase
MASISIITVSGNNHTMKFLFLFLDGVGLGEDNPQINPFAKAAMPHLITLLEGRRLLASQSPSESSRATLLALDACLGVDGLPQSATGQATLLTGLNIPAKIGYHYGPKPNPDVSIFLQNGNLFDALQNLGRKVGFINAYPPRYFDSIASRHRIYSAIPLAAANAGLELKTETALKNGTALSADFTGLGWRDHLGISGVPILEPQQAGAKLAELASLYDFAFFEYWMTDIAGHRQNMEEACRLLETLDAVIGGLTNAWEDEDGLILVTSDHGNLENLGTRRHTHNPVPALVIGEPALRQRFVESLHDLTSIAPTILNFLNGPPKNQ